MDEIFADQEKRNRKRKNTSIAIMNPITKLAVSAVENTAQRSAQMGSGIDVSHEVTETAEEEGEEKETSTSSPPTRPDQFIFFYIISDLIRRITRFRVTAREICMALRQPPINIDPIIWLERCIRAVHSYLVKECEQNDYIGLTIRDEQFSRGPAWLSFRSVRDFSVNDFWNLIESITQSLSEFRLTEKFNISSCVVKTPMGRGRSHLNFGTISKRSVLTIRNDDNLCLPRSIVTGIAHAERGHERQGRKHKKWSLLRHTNGKPQKQAAENLLLAADVSVPSQGCGIVEIRKFQTFLSANGIALVVYESSYLGNGGEPMFDGRPFLVRAGKALVHTINILHYASINHYEPILNLRAAIGARGFCSACNCVFSGGEEKHRCSHKCPRCKTQPQCPSDLEQIRCCECRRYFFGVVCYDNHKKGTRIH